MSSLNQPTVRHKRDKIYERLAKPGNDCSVYNNKHFQGELILKEYWVDQVFQDKISGFYALGLVSASGENPPVLVVRGFGNWGKLEEFPTEFLPYKDIPDVLMNHSDEHFQAAKNNGVIEWLHNKTVKEIKPEVVGQSLGGKVGQQLTVEVPGYIYSLVTFNSIGISLQEFEKYQGEVEIFHYINPADLIPYILGKKFLPGTIFQVFNPSIKSYDLLGQHNKLVLDYPITLIKEVDIEKFYWLRELYQIIRNYDQVVQKEIEELSQITKKEVTKSWRNIRNSRQVIRHKLENFSQDVQNEFIEIIQSIKQRVLEDIGGKGQESEQLFQKKVNHSVELIQNNVESLNQAVQQEINSSDATSNIFSQQLQELKDSMGAVQQKLAEFLKKV